jgi:hypothetical protein
VARFIAEAAAASNQKKINQFKDARFERFESGIVLKQ